MTHGSELLIGNELTNTSYEHGTSYPHQVRWADFFHLKFNMLLVIRLLCSSRGLILFLRHLKEKNKGECLIFWNAINLSSTVHTTVWINKKNLHFKHCVIFLKNWEPDKFCETSKIVPLYNIHYTVYVLVRLPKEEASL